MNSLILALCVMLALVGFYVLSTGSEAQLSFAFATTNNGRGRVRKLNVDGVLARVMRMDAPAQAAAPAVSHAPVFHAIESVLSVVVIDRNGYPTGEKRSIANTVWAEYFSDKAIVLIDWLYNGADEPDAELLAKPITVAINGSSDEDHRAINGKTFYGCYAWGSAIKKGLTIGLTEDTLRLTGMAQKSEDGQRAGRAYMPNAMYGAGRGTLRIYIAKKGELIADKYPVDDGFGYETRTTNLTIRNKCMGIDLGVVRDSFHMAQRLSWSKVLHLETIQYFQEVIAGLTDPTEMVKSNRLRLNDKEIYISLDPTMILHPYVANGLNKHSQESAVRAATSIPMAGQYKVAVPSTIVYDAEKRMGGVASLIKLILGRYPMDSNDSETAVEPIPDEKANVEAEIKRIDAMPVDQYTIYNTQFFAKGQMGVVDDSVLVIKGNQYDLVICEEDVKMASVKGGIKTIRGMTNITIDTYFGITMHYEAGNAIGINADMWKHMGGDFDGDGAVVVDCSERSILWRTCRELPVQHTDKLNKTNTGFEANGDKRIDMILKSRVCTKIVGFATNIMAATYAVKDRAALARELGYTMGVASSKVDLDWWLNFWVKVGTDGFKTDVNVEKAYRQLSIMQAMISSVLGGSAPWCRWHKDPMAFKHTLPIFARDNMTKEEERTSIPASMDGTVPEILKITLPQMVKFLTYSVEANPLSTYRYWAIRPDHDDLIEGASSLNRKYGVRSGSTNWTDSDSIDQFKVYYDAEVKAYDEQFAQYTRLERASALWNVAHGSQSPHAAAGSVFAASVYKDDVSYIITNKPGKSAKVGEHVVLLGLYNVLSESLQGEIGGLPVITCDVVVDDISVPDKKDARQSTIKKIVRANAPGMKPNSGEGLPADTLGMVAPNSFQPEPGIYCAVITRKTAKSWDCKLTVK